MNKNNLLALFLFISSFLTWELIRAQHLVAIVGKTVEDEKLMVLLYAIVAGLFYLILYRPIISRLPKWAKIATALCIPFTYFIDYGLSNLYYIHDLKYSTILLILGFITVTCLIGLWKAEMSHRPSFILLLFILWGALPFLSQPYQPNRAYNTQGNFDTNSDGMLLVPTKMGYLQNFLRTVGRDGCNYLSHGWDAENVFYYEQQDCPRLYSADGFYKFDPVTDRKGQFIETLPRTFSTGNTEEISKGRWRTSTDIDFCCPEMLDNIRNEIGYGFGEELFHYTGAFYSADGVYFATVGRSNLGRNQNIHLLDLEWKTR